MNIPMNFPWRRMNYFMATSRRKTQPNKYFLIMVCFGSFFGLPDICPGEELAILKSADISAYSEAISSFKSTLPPSFRVTLEYDLQGDMVKGRKFARRIRTSKAKVVLAVGLKAALAAKLEIPDLPILFCLVVDPERYGLPSNNMVGLSLDIPFPQRLTLLRRLMPKISRIGVIYDPQKTNGMKNKLLREAKGMGIQIVSEAVHSERDVPKALSTIKNRIDVLWLLPDSTVLTENTLDYLMSTTMGDNVPVVGFSAGLVRSGAVVGVYFHYADVGQQAAQFIERLVGLTPPSQLGMLISPQHVRQSINLRSARYLGLPLTPDILRQFDEKF